ncbi:MAG TPA: MATE family efflux transporter [Epulopiscium sp.]|nr:MATE family efflux transporter [Candidatus Epulonipiscium sp.]
MSNQLSEKDNQRRRFILQANMWGVVLAVSLPLAIYNSLNSIFTFLDSLMASYISSEVVSAVTYVSQIKGAIGAVGMGLALGGGIIIARHYGAGNMEKAKKVANTLLFLAIAIGLVLIVLIVPFTRPILRILNTPEELINVGSSYFAVEIIAVISMFINNVYIAIERAKGNTKKILYLNLMVLAIKLPLTALFIYVFHMGVTMMAVGTLIAHMVLTIIGMRDMLKPDNIFRLSIKDIELSKKMIWPILILGVPIFFEKFAFSFGKVIVNSMSVAYGGTVVGALGVSNNIGGIITGAGGGFQDGESAIISQNIGNNDFTRAIDAFKKTLIVSLALGLIGFVLTGIFGDQLIAIFAKGDMVFAKEIKNIFQYERYALITLTIASASMGFLYGFGYTKLSLIINFMRLFAFRIPILYGLQKFTTLESKGVGIAMMVSNLLVGILSLSIVLIVIWRMKKGKDIDVVI